MTLAVLLSASSLLAATYYVDNKLEDYTGADGSELKPYQRIQTAVERAASGDTVIVKPGVYGDDQGTVIDNQSNGGNENYSYRPNRVWINAKHITLKSSDGAAVTHIVGRHDSDTTTGIGSNAVRCIALSGNSAIGGTRIEGFTLRDGGTIGYGEGWTINSSTGQPVKQCSASHRGGALLFNYVQGTTGSFRTWQRIHVVDCVISNCVAAEGAAAFGVSLVRCRVTQNRTYRGRGGIVFDGNLANCILDRNGSAYSEYAVLKDNNGALTAIGCTFYNNCGTLSSAGDSTLINCFYESSTPLRRSDGKGVVINGVGDAQANLTGDSGCTHLSDRGHQAVLVAPIYGDFRPVLKPCYPAMFNKGSKALCEAQEWMDADDRDKDFFGQPRWDADGHVTVGAIQDGYDVAGGCLTVSYGKYWIDGEYFDGPFNGYFYTDIPLSQHRIRLVPSDNAFVASAWIGGYGNLTTFPDRYGDFYLVAPPSSTNSMRCLAPNSVYTNTVASATSAVWADATYEGMDSDGSAARPYRTLQAAVDATASKSTRLVLARPGRYDEGGRFLNGNARLCLTNGVCVYALEGPEKTFIVGADGEGGAADGCGTNAWRCVACKPLGSSYCGVVGFTLTDGRTCANDSVCSADMRMGGGLWTSTPLCAQLIDCVITNCVAVRGSATYYGWLINCRVLGNRQADVRDADAGQGRTDRRGVVYKSRVSGSVIGPNSFSLTSVDQEAILWGCTLHETSSTLHASADASYYNTLDLATPSLSKRNGDFVGCAVETANPASVECDTCLKLTPPAPIADRTCGDFRPLAGSQLLTYGQVPADKVADFCNYTVGCFDKSTFAPGQPAVGACYEPFAPVTLTKSRGVEVTGGLYGTPFASVRHPLTLTATRTDCAFAGFEVNGELATTNRVLTLTGEGASAYTVKPLYCSGLMLIVR